MNSCVSAAFREALAALPIEIQELAFKNFALWQANPRHPSLQFKKVGAYWSVRIGRDYRALATLEDETFRWFWVGTHQEYQRWLLSESFFGVGGESGHVIVEVLSLRSNAAFPSRCFL